MSTEDFPEASFEAAIAAANLTFPTEAAVVGSQPLEQQPAPATTQPATQEPPAVVPPGPAPVPQYLLDREAALEAREKATRTAESKAREVEQRAAALEAREAAVENAATEFEADPVGFARKLRPDLTPAQAAKWAERFYAVALGKDAPPELRLEQKIAEIDRNAKQANERLSKQLEERDRQDAARAQAAMVAEYTSKLKASASDLKADVHPILSNLAKTDPDQFAKELFEEAVKDCQAQWAVDSSKEPVPPESAELAKRAEARIKAQLAKYGQVAPAAQAPQTPPVDITNRTAASQPPRTQPDPDDNKVLRAAALKAAGLDHISVWD